MLVVRTKLNPPRLHKRILPRPRLGSRLRQALDHRLTVIQAEAGYGKSTALAALAASQRMAWYHLDQEDAELQVFMQHLVYALRMAVPLLSEAPQALLEAWHTPGAERRMTTAVDTLVNELDAHLAGPLLLVLDDAHHLCQSPQVLQALDRLVDRAPHDFHMVLSTRLPIPLPSLVSWRVHGEVLEIDRRELAFTEAETAALFTEHYGLQLSPEEIHWLTTQTEGWAIALQLIRQGVFARPASNSQATALTRLQKGMAATAEDLFIYLTQEVLAQQPPDVLAFLRQTAVLRELSPAICDCMMSQADQGMPSPPASRALLRYLQENGLFVVALDDGHLRYHHLFQELLRRPLAPAEISAAHRHAADCYRQAGDLEEALHHLLAAPAWEEAATLLRSLGRGMVATGRLDTLAGWISALSPDVLERHPPLMVYLGDIARLHSRFGEALGWCQQAETNARALGDVRDIGQALRGQARVYLDTVNPSQAEHLLQEALRLADGQEDRESRIRLLELMAENRLNLGRLEDAARFQEQAQALRAEVPSEAEMAVRVLIRTGRLAEAQALLEERAMAERTSPVLRPRAHRETLLLLSLLLSFQGEAEAAQRSAIEGTARGQALDSPFIAAVGLMREGHAWHLQDRAGANDRAVGCFREAIAIADSLDVPRLKVEAFWGLCRASGFQGDITAAEEAAVEGIAIAQQTGDEWITALIRLALAGAYVGVGRPEDAGPLLAEAMAAFRECSDVFGSTVVQLWQCLIWHAAGDHTRLARGLEELLSTSQEHGYDFLFLRRTLLGPPDPRRTVPLLLAARGDSRHRPYAEALLGRLGLSRLEVHPGYQLRVQLLGSFEVWRGAEPMPAQDWRRDKARQLFQLLVTHRQRLLERSQVVEMLWPGLDGETATRDFKVALSTLVRALEPGLQPRAPSAFVAREGTLYGLRPGADIWLDAAEFERLCAEGDRLFAQGSEDALACYRQAMTLYGGDYLQDYPYDEWASEERERLLSLFLRVADRLAHALAEKQRWQETIEVAEAILQRDDCWEQAYRLMMLAFAGLGNHSQAMRAYQRCASRLRQELNINPSPSTVRLHEMLLTGTSR